MNYVAPDRSDIQWAVKEVLRHSSEPTEADEIRIKRICRYLKGVPRAVLKFEWQETPEELTVLVDSDFAGCTKTRKSCSGGAIMWGGHCIKTWAKTLSVLALSSGEAELGAVVKGACEGLGVQSALKDLGFVVKVHLRSDATAAIGIVERLGLGKVRHLAVADLWVQQALRDGRIRVSKVKGADNQADAMTKPLDEQTLWRHMEAIGLWRSTGRAQVAPQAVAVAVAGVGR